MFCPICNNQTLIEGEVCDVGFGYDCGVKIGPDHCEFCEYVEAGSDLTPSFEHYEKCWELQIDPNPPVPVCSVGEIDPKYLPFFLNQEEAYGNCHEQCLKLAEAFPNLKIVMGSYFDWAWGSRDHFWCVDGETIIDPTVSQFPSPSGIYKPSRYVSKEVLMERLWG